MRLDRRIGALLLLIGGVMELVRLVVFTGFTSISLSEPASIAVNLIPSALIGCGLVAMGFSYRGRGRLGLVAAGLLGLAVVAVNVVQIATHSPLGPAPSEFAYLTSQAAVVAAALLLLSDRSLRGSARWAIAIPAGGTVLFFVSLFTLPVTWFVLLPGIGFAIAGALLMWPEDEPAAVSAH